MNVERMMEMREAFANTPEEEVFMGSWGHRDRCGTKCCLAGAYLLAVDPKDEAGPIGRIGIDRTEETVPISSLPLEQNWHIDFRNDRLRDYLGIDSDAYDYLFVNSASDTKQEALARLDAFIASGGEIPEPELEEEDE